MYAVQSSGCHGMIGDDDCQQNILAKKSNTNVYQVDDKAFVARVRAVSGLEFQHRVRRALLLQKRVSCVFECCKTAKLRGRFFSQFFFIL
jgi:hypothetical protein